MVRGPVYHRNASATPSMARARAMPAARQAAQSHLHSQLPDHRSSVARQALFAKYDVNKDHMLDVGEAVELLKAVCADNDLTTEWITPDMMKEQFRVAQGGVAPEGVALTKEEFEAFCKYITTFMSHLGSTTLSDTPFEERLAAAREIDAAEKAAAAAAAPRRKGGCVLL